MSKPVRFAVKDGVATITLARPEAGNAMNWDLVDTFTKTVLTIAEDDGVRAVLIEAEGNNFCVGGDLKVFAGEADPSDFIRKLAGRLHEGVVALASCSAPVIAAVQGAAAGAGLSLVAGCDLVIAGRSSHFSFAYTAIGLVSDGGATWYLPRLIGLRRTQDMALTNRRLSADEALDDGLVTRVVDDEAVRGEARALAAQIAGGPTFAFGQVKRLLAQSFTTDLPLQLDAEAEAMASAMRTADAKGAVAAFLERRKPAFSGR